MIGGIQSYMGMFGTGASSSIPATSQVFDYKAAQQDAKALIAQYKTDAAQVKTLKTDAAAFLDSYTKGMVEMQSAASKVSGANLDKLLYDKSGNVTDDTVNNTVKAVQDMVDQYNSNLKLLNDNADRGSGVTKQIARMSDDPAPLSSMKMVGMDVAKDGTLTLDQTKLADALKTSSSGQRQLFADIIGGRSGIAQGVKNDAQAGLNTSAARLIQNDLAEMQNLGQENGFSTLASYSRQGAFGLANMGTVGMLMNFAV